MGFRCVARRTGVPRGLMEGVPDPPGEAGDEVDLLRSVADGFVDAFNRRDVDDLVRLCEPDVEWYPASLAGEDRSYRGHDGMVSWVAHLDRSGLAHRIDVLNVTPLNPRRFMLAGRVLVALNDVASLIMTVTLSRVGRIAK